MSVAIKLHDAYDGNKVRKEEFRESKEDVRVLGFDLNNLSKTSQFLVCCTAVFAFYITYGYLQVWFVQRKLICGYRGCCNMLYFFPWQELIFSSKAFKPCGWYLTLIQFGFYSVFSLAELYFQGILNERRYILNLICVLCETNWQLISMQ